MGGGYPSCPVLFFQGSSGLCSGQEPRRPGGQLVDQGAKGLCCQKRIPAVSRGMDHSEGVTQASAGTVVPQELLEEMLWFFRVEDGKWWEIGGAVVGCTPQHKGGHLVEVP